MQSIGLSILHLQITLIASQAPLFVKASKVRASSSSVDSVATKLPSTALRPVPLCWANVTSSVDWLEKYEIPAGYLQSERQIGQDGHMDGLTPIR